MSSRDTLERAIKRIDNTHSARNTLERSARQNFRPATSKAAAVDDVNSGTQDILEDDLIQFILPSITLSKEQITQFFGMANELKLILKFNKHLREVAKKFGRNLEECVLNNDSLVKVQNLPSGKEIVSETSFSAPMIKYKRFLQEVGVSHDSEDYTNAIEYLTIDLEDGVKSCTSSISEKEWTLERSNNKSHGADDKSTSCYPPDAMINNENYAPVPDIQITKKTKKATKAVKHQQKKRPEVQSKVYSKSTSALLVNAVSAATPAIAINTVNTCTSTTRARKSNDNNAVTCISAAGLSSRATTKSNVSITEATTSALSSSAKTLSSVVDPPSKKKEKQGTTIHPIVFNNCFVTTSELDLEDTEIQARIDSLHPAPSGALDTPYAAHQHSVSLNNLQIPGKTTAGSKPLPLKDNNNRRKSDLPGLSKTPFTLLSDSSRHPVENAHGQKLAVLTPSISIIGGVDGGDGSCNDATASEEGLSLQKHRFMPFELSPPKNHVRSRSTGALLPEINVSTPSSDSSHNSINSSSSSSSSRECVVMSIQNMGTSFRERRQSRSGGCFNSSDLAVANTKLGVLVPSIPKDVLARTRQHLGI